MVIKGGRRGYEPVHLLAPTLRPSPRPPACLAAYLPPCLLFQNRQKLLTAGASLIERSIRSLQKVVCSTQLGCTHTYTHPPNHRNIHTRKKRGWNVFSFDCRHAFPFFSLLPDFAGVRLGVRREICGRVDCKRLRVGRPSSAGKEIKLKTLSLPSNQIS